jgi:hypothetical protein
LSLFFSSRPVRDLPTMTWAVFRWKPPDEITQWRQCREFQTRSILQIQVSPQSTATFRTGNTTNVGNGS